MSTTLLLQSKIAELVRAALPVKAPVVAQRKKLMPADIDEATAVKSGLCVLVLPPRHLRQEQGVSFVFGTYEVRVRIVEIPNMNGHQADIWDLQDAIEAALHWREIPELLPSHPLSLAPRPTEFVDDPKTRVLDVIFEAVMPLVRTET
jgi:hypothetical protein